MVSDQYEDTTGKRNELRKLAAWMAVLLAGAAPLAGRRRCGKQRQRADSFRRRGIGGRVRPARSAKNTNYANLLSTQYDMLEPGNAMKWT